MMRRTLPESPRWLAGTGRTKEADRALQLFEGDPATITADRSQHNTRSPEHAQGHRLQTAKSGRPLDRLLSPPYRRRLAMMLIFHTFQTFGYYGFGTLAALVLVARGYDITSSLLYTALSFVGYPVGSALAVPLLKRYERKFLVIGSCAAMAGCGLLFATVDSVMLIVTFGFLTTAISNVFSNAYHVYQAEIFPTDVRATAVGGVYALSRLSSGALPFILLPVLDLHGPAAMFTVVLTALIITLSAVALVGPRTTWRSLEEINPT
jgi:MFS family permease